MTLILALETSTEVTSAALILNGEVLSSTNLNTKNAHSRFLSGIVNDLFRFSDREYKDLSAVAVSAGPGSYTGLRIGSSFAKGICYSLGIPLIGVPTLQAIASSISKTISSDALICAMIDARRMEVYSSVFNQVLETVEETTNVIVDEGSYQNILERQEVYFVGNAVDKCKSSLEQHPNARFIKEHGISAENVGLLGHGRYLNEKFEDVAYFEPFYLKEFVAGKPKKSVLG